MNSDDYDDKKEAEKLLKKDANDYSRFNTIDDDDDDDDVDDKENKNLLSIDEALSKSNKSKEEGNTLFKQGDFKGAQGKYSEALQFLESFKDTKPPVITEAHCDEVRNLQISLNGNLAMIHIKEEDWKKAITVSKVVLKLDASNVKALFRRGVAYHKTGFLNEAKADLLSCIELDMNNMPAKKELIEVNKSIKEQAQKEKASFGNMFSKGSMYEDREKERQEKLKREEVEKERQKDEWNQSKLARREKGLPEQTFEDWKKETDEEADRLKKQRDSSSSSSTPSNPPKTTAAKTKKKATKSNNKETANENSVASDDDVYDDEDAKIISETTKKGYCYFRKELSSDAKALIGDITPKALGSEEPEPDTKLAADSTAASGSSKASTWNSAGTWEERDLSTGAKERLKMLCRQISVVLPPMDMTDPQALSEAMQLMQTNLPSSNTDTSTTSNTMEELGMTLSTITINVVDVTTLDGEAHSVFARGKTRYLYDFQMKYDIEICINNNLPKDPNAMDVASDESDKPNIKQYKAVVEINEITPENINNLEYAIKYKKRIPKSAEKRVNLAMEKFKQTFCQTIQTFDMEFKAM